MKLYKDKDCTKPAECPLSLANPNLEKWYIGPYICDTDCAWSVHNEEHDGYTCGMANACQLMYAKAVK